MLSHVLSSAISGANAVMDLFINWLASSTALADESLKDVKTSLSDSSAEKK